MAANSPLALGRLDREAIRQHDRLGASKRRAGQQVWVPVQENRSAARSRVPVSLSFARAVSSPKCNSAA
jgi:hypothetical protein